MQGEEKVGGVLREVFDYVFPLQREALGERDEHGAAVLRGGRNAGEVRPGQLPWQHREHGLGAASGVGLRRLRFGLVLGEQGVQVVVEDERADAVEDLGDPAHRHVAVAVEEAQVEGLVDKGGGEGDGQAGVGAVAWRGVTADAVEDGLRLGGQAEEDVVVGVATDVVNDVDADELQPHEEGDYVAGDFGGGAEGDELVVHPAVQLVEGENVADGENSHWLPKNERGWSWIGRRWQFVGFRGGATPQRLLGRDDERKRCDVGRRSDDCR